MTDYLCLMQSPLISILMPVKDAAKFLALTVSSVQNQGYKNWELLAVDDHSNDKSAEILHSLAAHDARIKVFSNESNGIIDALHTAYINASGSFVTRMDADDLMCSGKLNALLKVLKENDENVVATGLVKAFAAPGKCGYGFARYAAKLNKFNSSANPWDFIFNDCVVPSPCWMISTKNLNKIGAFESTLYPEDYDLCFRMYAAGLKVKCVNQILHLWRDHPERVSRVSPIYAEPEFFPLKLRYFLKLSHQPGKPLIFYGAGPKAKKFVKLVKAEYPDLKFHWTTGNERKWGNSIYGQMIAEKSILNQQTGATAIWLVSSRGSEVDKFKENYPGIRWIPFC